MSATDPRGEIKVDPNIELKDYSGPFKPDLKFTDFSREQLVRMLIRANQYFMDSMFAFTHYIYEKYGTEATRDLHYDAWVNKIAPVWHIAQAKEMGITGNDVETVMKLLQVGQVDWSPVLFDLTYEMPSKDCGVITCNRCIGVELWEAMEQQPPDQRWEGFGKQTKESGKDLLSVLCEIDVATLEAWARAVNPDIVVKALKLPPRKSKDDICCKWEFTYKSN